MRTIFSQIHAISRWFSETDIESNKSCRGIAVNIKRWVVLQLSIETRIWGQICVRFKSCSAYFPGIITRLSSKEISR